jgi:hypothetical protein
LHPRCLFEAAASATGTCSTEAENMDAATVAGGPSRTGSVGAAAPVEVRVDSVAA